MRKLNSFVKLWIGLALLALISPLGVILPSYFKSGKAWGEWSQEEIQHLAGNVPQGLKKFGDFWKAPMPDYSFKGWEGKGLSNLAYLISGIAGVVLTVIVVLLIGKMLSKKEDNG